MRSSRRIRLRAHRAVSTYQQAKLKLDRYESKADRARAAKAWELQSDAEGFFRKVLGFTPYGYQLELAELFEKNQFVAARWCRQSGKSWMVSALLLKYAWENPSSYIAIVGPSWHQNKIHLFSGFPESNVPL